MEIKNKELFKQQCFINGEWVNANNGEKIEVNIENKTHFPLLIL